jgi:hypothetical protein
MEEYTVIKKGSTIRHCIRIPDELLDKDLEIKIRPIAHKEHIIDQLQQIYARYEGVNPFASMKDPAKWEIEIRSEW